MYARLGKWIIVYPRRTIMIVVALSMLLLGGLYHIRFVSDFDSTLPNRSPLTKQILENQKRFGGKNSIAFLVANGSAAASSRHSPFAVHHSPSHAG